MTKDSENETLEPISSESSETRGSTKSAERHFVMGSHFVSYDEKNANQINSKMKSFLIFTPLMAMNQIYCFAQTNNFEIKQKINLLVNSIVIFLSH